VREAVGEHRCKARELDRVAGTGHAFNDGEPITTEYSYKYDLDEFEALAASAGFARRRIWTDEARLFSVQYYAVDPSSSAGLR